MISEPSGPRPAPHSLPSSRLVAAVLPWPTLAVLAITSPSLTVLPNVSREIRMKQGFLGRIQELRHLAGSGEGDRTLALGLGDHAGQL